MARCWVLLGVMALLAGLLSLTPAGPASAAAASPFHGRSASGAGTRPEHSYADAVREHVLVQTAVDSDGDGDPDEVGVDIIRPRETTDGLRVPVIMDTSPYYDNLGRGNEAERKRYDAQGRPISFPLFYDNYFVPRGYAVAQVDMLGTNRSQGCPVTGGPQEVRAATAVVRWLAGNGSARYPDGSRARPSWSTGKTGMIGKSYDGTLANAVASTGVKGLSTIVPIAAISSWYDYYRYGGAAYFRGGPPGLADVVDTDPPEKCADVRAQLDAGADDATGDLNAFWDRRNYRTGGETSAHNVRASVFAVHGLNDLNVKPNHFSRWWQRLADEGVPRKLWLSRTGHVDPFDFRREKWIDTLHDWFDYWLYNIDTGVLDQPRVDVQLGPQQWQTQQRWPAAGAAPARLWLGPQEGHRPGTLGRRPAAGLPKQSFRDERYQTEREMIANPATSDPHRLLYLTPPLQRAARISGTPEITLAARVDQPDAHLTALLVDYGSAERVDHLDRGEGIETLPEEGCYGEGTEADDPCYHLTRTDTRTAPAEILARGWLDARNRDSLRTERALRPGRRYQFRWDLLPQDYRIPAGHRIGLVIASSDAGQLADDRRAAGAGIEVSLWRSAVRLPVVGGRGGLQFAPTESDRSRDRTSAAPPSRAELRAPVTELPEYQRPRHLIPAGPRSP